MSMFADYFDLKEERRQKKIDRQKTRMKMGGHNKDALNQSTNDKIYSKRAKEEMDRKARRKAKVDARIKEQKERKKRTVAPVEKFMNGGCVMKGRGGSFKGIS